LSGVAGVEGGGKVKEGVSDEVEDGIDVGVGTEIRGWSWYCYWIEA
jgi:hypothetical protein